MAEIVGRYHGRSMRQTPHLLFEAAALVLVAWAASACDDRDGPGADADADGGRDADTPDSEVEADVDVASAACDHSEVVSPIARPTSLLLESEQDVTPGGAAAHRPDAVAIGDEVWLAYAGAAAGFQLQRFDTDLNPLGDPVDLEHGETEMPTDIRAGVTNGRLWYAYETVVMPSADCEHNFLGVATYSGDVPPVLVRSGPHIATGCPTSVEFITNPTGLPEDPEAVDDPTPFCHDDTLYVLTRAWPGVADEPHHLRRLDGDLAVVEHSLLDSSPLVPGTQMAQNALLHIDGRPYLVAGFPSGPPIDPFESVLSVLELSDDLRSFVGEAVPLAVPDATYPQRVTRALHVNGTLVIHYNDRYQGQPTREFLALFDVAAGFAYLSQVQVQDHEVMDNHSSFAIVGDRLYLFQQQDGERISAKVFRLQP
jgi:hypothetical protein